MVNKKTDRIGEKNFWYKVKKYKVLLLMILPTVLYYFLFSYIPMAGIVVAFKNYNFTDGIFGSPWSGIDNFKFFFISGQAFRVTRNTILYNLAFIIVNTLLQITTAIFLTELAGKYFRKISQSIMFFPYFISWVIVGIMSYNIFNYDHGNLNSFLKFVHVPPINVYSNPIAWIFIIIIFCAWKSIGYGTILYLAAIMGIDTEVYEAAEIDGSNIFQRIFYITIPSLVPTIIILTLLAIGNIFRGDFQMFYQLIGNNGIVYNATDVIDTFTFRSLIQSNNFGMSAASGLYQSMLCLIIITIANYVVKKFEPDYALF